MPLDKSKILMLLLNAMSSVSRPIKINLLLRQLQEILYSYDCLSGTRYIKPKLSWNRKKLLFRDPDVGSYYLKERKLSAKHDNGDEINLNGSTLHAVNFSEQKRELGQVLSLIVGRPDFFIDTDQQSSPNQLSEASKNKRDQSNTNQQDTNLLGDSFITRRYKPLKSVEFNQIKKVFSELNNGISLKAIGFIRFLDKLIRFCQNNPNDKKDVIDIVIPLIASAVHQREARSVLNNPIYRGSPDFISRNTQIILALKCNDFKKEELNNCIERFNLAQDETKRNEEFKSIIRNSKNGRIQNDDGSYKFTCQRMAKQFISDKLFEEGTTIHRLCKQVANGKININ